MKEPHKMETRVHNITRIMFQLYIDNNVLVRSVTGMNNFNMNRKQTQKLFVTMCL